RSSTTSARWSSSEPDLPDAIVHLDGVRGDRDSIAEAAEALNLVQAVAVEEQRVARLVRDDLARRGDLAGRGLVAALVEHVPEAETAAPLGWLEHEHERERAGVALELMLGEALGVEVDDASALGEPPFGREDVDTGSAEAAAAAHLAGEQRAIQGDD